MKIIIITYLLLAHAFIGVAVVKTDIIPRLQKKFGYEKITLELTPHYHTMVTFHKRVDKNIPDGSTIFIGDSLTQGLAVTAAFPQSINFGIGQDTTVGALKRIPFYHSITKAKRVIIAIGVNDLKKRNNDEIIKNYLKIISLIPKNIPILFSGILPIDESANNRTGTNNRIEKLNNRLSKICENNKKLHFLNISTLLVNANGNLSKNYHIGDGIHLNGLGSKIWISKLKTYNQKIIEKMDATHDN